jgi:hypothetical protein
VAYEVCPGYLADPVARDRASIDGLRRALAGLAAA